MSQRVILYIDLISIAAAGGGIISLALVCQMFFGRKREDGRYEYFIVSSIAFFFAWAIPEAASLMGWAVLGNWMYMYTSSTIVGVLGLVSLVITALEARKGSDKLGIAVLFSVGFFFLAWIFILPVTLSRFLLNN